MASVEKFEDLKKLTLLVSSEGLQTYYKWMEAEFGFTEKQTKPYTFNPQPFLVDKNSAMQGYVTSEPFAVEKAGVVKPTVDFRKSYTLQFVNKGVGLELRPKN